VRHRLGSGRSERLVDGRQAEHVDTSQKVRLSCNPTWKSQSFGKAMVGSRAVPASTVWPSRRGRHKWDAIRSQPAECGDEDIEAPSWERERPDGPDDRWLPRNPWCQSVAHRTMLECGRGSVHHALALRMAHQVKGWVENRGRATHLIFVVCRTAISRVSPAAAAGSWARLPWRCNTSAWQSPESSGPYRRDQVP